MDEPLARKRGRPRKYEYETKEEKNKISHSIYYQKNKEKEHARNKINYEKRKMEYKKLKELKEVLKALI